MPEASTHTLLPKAKPNEIDWMGYHRTQFQRVRGLMPERDRLASGLFIVAPIRSDEGRAMLRDMIELCRQDHEVAFRPDLEPEKCRCPTTDSKRIIDRFVKPSSFIYQAKADYVHFKQQTSRCKMETYIWLLPEASCGEPWFCGTVLPLQRMDCQRRGME